MTDAKPLTPEFAEHELSKSGKEPVEKGLDVMRMPITGTTLSVASFGNLNLRFLVQDETQYMHLCLCMREICLLKVYDKYDVKGKTVIDVGGFLGDSAVYFSRRGAAKVIVYEPFASGDLIYPNAVLNHAPNIKVIRKPVTGTPGLPFNPNRPNDSGTQFDVDWKTEDLNDASFALEDIAVRDAILKMDCEGSEHGIFKTAYRETLRKFSAVMVECHLSYGDVEKKLTDCGFLIDEVNPVSPGQYWMLYARRQD